MVPLLAMILIMCLLLRVQDRVTYGFINSVQLFKDLGLVSLIFILIPLFVLSIDLCSNFHLCFLQLTLDLIFTITDLSIFLLRHFWTQFLSVSNPNIK